MKRFQIKWDDKLESLAQQLDDFKKCSSLRTNINNLPMIKKIKSLVNIKLPLLYRFIAKCNKGQSPVLKFRGKEYAMTYQARRLLVYSLASLPLVFNNKGFIKRYAFWSVFFLRETFNLRYYKFHHTHTEDKSKI